MTAELYQLLTITIQSITAIVIAYIALRQASLNKTMNQLEKNTNHKLGELLITTKEAALAEGNLRGRLEQTAERTRE